jgi:hypothetical protein
MKRKRQEETKEIRSVARKTARQMFSEMMRAGATPTEMLKMAEQMQ